MRPLSMDETKRFIELVAENRSFQVVDPGREWVKMPDGRVSMGMWLECTTEGQPERFCVPVHHLAKVLMKLHREAPTPLDAEPAAHEHDHDRDHPHGEALHHHRG